MQQLFDILTHKLTLINGTISNLTNTQKDELLDQLIIEKKKETLRILVQSRLQQSLDTKIVCEAEQLNTIIAKAHKVMSICDKQLELPQREEPLLVMVELFYTFFNGQNCTNRAQEIINMYKKKLCPRGMLPSTLFNWLVEWTRKQFQEYLKKTIHSLYVDSRHPKTHRQSIKDQLQHSKKDQSYLIIQKKQTFPNSKTIVPSDHIQRKQMQSLDTDQRIVQKIRIKSQSPSQKSLRYPSIESIEPDLPINKEVFYYAYSQEIQNLYKQLQNCIPDLDIGFVRGLRRGGVRRKEVKRRIKEVACNLIKHMGSIKQGIQRYYEQYTNGHNKAQQGKRAKKQRRITLNSECQSPSKTSQGIRTVSTSTKNIDERRVRIISTLSIKNRYDSQQHQLDSLSRSNLLPFQNMHFPNKEKKRLEGASNTIDLSIGSPRQRQSKILILNAAYISPNLQIIQEKRQKQKGKSGSKHHQSLSKKQAHKAKFSKSIDLKDNQQFERAYNSIDVSASSHLHLPKIRRLK